MKAPRGTYVAYATSPGAVAVDGEENNSPFTLALSESIKQPGLTLEAVLKLTRSKVQTLTNGAQLPFDSSAITGEFYFVPVVAQTPAQTIEPQKLYQLDTAQEAYQAAGEDPDLLRIVADRFADTIWGALAIEKLKKLAPEKPVVETPPVVEKPAVVETPATVEPAPKKKVVIDDRKVEPPKKTKPVKPVVKKTVRVFVPPPKPKRKVVIIAPKPKRIVVAPRPVASVGLRCDSTAALQRGVLCKSNDGRICRVASVRFSKGGGRPVLMGCH